MSFLVAIIGEFFKGVFGAVNSWLSGQQAHADAVTVGQKTQQTADDQVVIKTTQAETQAAVDSPRTISGVESELDKGQF